MQDERRRLTNKKPRGVSGGANFLFLFIKRGNCEFFRPDTELLLLLDLDLIVFVVIVLLASKSSTGPLDTANCSYTSLGQSYKSKTCANRSVTGRNQALPPAEPTSWSMKPSFLSTFPTVRATLHKPMDKEVLLKR